MPLFPTSPLDKAKLRSLLARWLHPQAGELPLSPSDRRKTEQWVIELSWLNAQGLTPEGNLVATKDPYLETTVTDWLIHFHLSTGDQRLWRYVIGDFMSAQITFTQDELLQACIHAFSLESQEQLKKSLKLMLKAYTESNAIAKIQFITKQSKKYSKSYPDLSNTYTMGYIFAKLWEDQFQSRDSILVNEILSEKVKLGVVLGIDQDSLKSELDRLAKHQIIEQRSAKPHSVGIKTQPREENEFPYQIYRCWESSLELLEKAYENDIATPNRPLIQSLASVLDDNDSTPDLLKFLEWASRLSLLERGSNTIVKLAS